MYFVKMGGLLFLRCPGLPGKTAAEGGGLLDMNNIQRYRDSLQKGNRGYTSSNPVLKGIPPTSSRTAPPLVVTMGTSGV